MGGKKRKLQTEVQGEWDKRFLVISYHPPEMGAGFSESCSQVQKHTRLDFCSTHEKPLFFCFFMTR